MKTFNQFAEDAEKLKKSLSPLKELGKDANISVTKFLNNLQNFKIPKK